MTKLLAPVGAFFSGASGNLRKIVLAFLVASLVLRYPALIAWLGEDIAKPIMAAAYEIRSVGLGFILLFVKQFNATSSPK